MIFYHFSHCTMCLVSVLMCFINAKFILFVSHYVEKGSGLEDRMVILLPFCALENLFVTLVSVFFVLKQTNKIK